MKNKLYYIGALILFIISMPIKAELKPCAPYMCETVGNIDITIPPGTVNNVRKFEDFALASVGTQNKRITYTKRITINSDYCGTKEEDYYWIEPKFHESLTGALANYFSHIFTVKGQNVNGYEAYQYIKASKNENIDLKLEFTLRPEFLYTAESITIPKDTPLIVMTMLCAKRLSNDEGYRDERQKQRQFNIFTVKSQNDATITFDRTCILDEKSRVQQVLLNPVNLSTLNQEGKVKGNDFTISLNCLGAQVKHAYIGVSDALNPTNSTEILTTESGNGAAKGVGIQIENDDGKILKYGQLPSLPFANPSDSNITLFNGNILNSGMINKRYTAYYIKNNKEELTAGTVKAKLFYNLYYN